MSFFFVFSEHNLMKRKEENAMEMHMGTKLYIKTHLNLPFSLFFALLNYKSECKITERINTL